MPTHTSLNLDEMIDVLKTHGMFGDDFEEVDVLYDNSAIYMAELYLEWMDTAKLKCENENLWVMVSIFSANRSALE